MTRHILMRALLALASLAAMALAGGASIRL